MAQVDNQGQLLNKSLNAKNIADRKVDELIGLCRGLTADGVVNIQEAEFLLSWIEANRDRAPSYPFDVLFRRLSEMLEDNILDNDEQDELIEMLTKITGGESLHDDIESMSSTLPLCIPEPHIEINGNNFVFTGVFNTGARKVLESLTEDLGGVMQKGVVRTTNYLVIGDIGSRDWKHSSFGRKIEKAVHDRDEVKTGLKIVSESHWIKFI